MDKSRCLMTKRYLFGSNTSSTERKCLFGQLKVLRIYVVFLQVQVREEDASNFCFIGILPEAYGQLLLSKVMELTSINQSQSTKATIV